MWPGATELTLIPCGPSSLASDWAIASSAALVALYGPIVRCENLTTIELIMVTDPALAASAGVNSRVSLQRSEHVHVEGRLDRIKVDDGQVFDRRHREGVVHQRVGAAELGERGIPEPLRRVGVGDVGRHGQRPPAERGDLLGDLLQAGLRARGEHHVRALLGAADRDRAAEPRADARRR